MKNSNSALVGWDLGLTRCHVLIFYIISIIILTWDQPSHFKFRTRESKLLDNYEVLIVGGTVTGRWLFAQDR
jgi:hypothetical protein